MSSKASQNSKKYQLDGDDQQQFQPKKQSMLLGADQESQQQQQQSRQYGKNSDKQSQKSFKSSQMHKVNNIGYDEEEEQMINELRSTQNNRQKAVSTKKSESPGMPMAEHGQQLLNHAHQQDQEMNAAHRYLKTEMEAASGEWGARSVIATNIQGGISKLGQVVDRVNERVQTGEVRDRLMQIYGKQNRPPENFVAQMAFTSLNGFLLTTDGRVFSWGALHYCLGRQNYSGNDQKVTPGAAATHKQQIEIGEIEFGRQNPIVQIATGRSHCVALDAKGKVWSWGTNDKGQLGHSFKDVAVKPQPKLIQRLQNICQIYCGEYSSFAVDNLGDIKAWGCNKNNALLTNQLDRGIEENIVSDPKLVQLPDYFIRSNRSNVVPNNQQGYDIYSSSKPVKSESSRTQEELEKAREENAKLRKRVKDYAARFAKINAGSLAGGVEAGGGDPQEEGEGGAQTEDVQFEKLCSNDKVIQNIKTLIDKNKKEKQDRQKEYKELSIKLKNIQREVNQLNDQLRDLDANQQQYIKDIQEQINAKEAAAQGSSDAKSEAAQFKKQKLNERRDIEKANNARKTMLQKQLVKKEQDKYDFDTKLRDAKNTMDYSKENAEIFLEVKQERRRFLMSSYLMKGQDDLEMILETLHENFNSIKLTSFEELARYNTENKSAKQLLEQSNEQLKQLAKTLELLQMDEEDVRYDVFSMIYEMLFDNIQLRVKQNKLSSRMLGQISLNLDNTVKEYIKKGPKPNILGDAQNYSAKLMESQKQRLEAGQHYEAEQVLSEQSDDQQYIKQSEQGSRRGEQSSYLSKQSSRRGGNAPQQYPSASSSKRSNKKSVKSKSSKQSKAYLEDGHEQSIEDQLRSQLSRQDQEYEEQQHQKRQSNQNNQRQPQQAQNKQQMMQNYMDEEEEEVDIMGGLGQMDSDDHEDDWASDGQ